LCGPRACSGIYGHEFVRGDVEAIITAAAQAQGVDPSWLISTAECESGLNPNAYNGAGPYDGLFQFLPSTFAAHGGGDIWDPTQQAQIAATMFANGESESGPSARVSRVLLHPGGRRRGFGSAPEGYHL